MSTLHAATIQFILRDLDLAIKHRDCPEVVEDRVNSAKERLLRAALADVDVEPVQASLFELAA
jgi:hypothetical protein